MELLRKKNSYPLFITVLILIFSNMVIANEKNVSLVTEPSWAPFYGKNLKNGGYLTEIIRQAFKVKGYNITVDWKPWKRAVVESEMGVYNGLLGTYYNKERAKKLAFSDPIDKDEIVFFSKKGRGIKYKKLTDLEPYVIGTGVGFTYTKEFDSADYLKKYPVVYTEQNIRKLLSNRIDLFVDSKKVVLHIIKKKLPKHIGALEILTPELETQYFHIGFSKKNPHHKQLVKDFNQGLKIIKKNGTIDAIKKLYGI
ncbi:MAG: transporter substrate-binding domain-containing protein [bacterium]|nr:transporter substrate-binding domain-containing protein [bacterium]